MRNHKNQHTLIKHFVKLKIKLKKTPCLRICTKGWGTFFVKLKLFLCIAHSTFNLFILAQLFWISCIHYPFSKLLSLNIPSILSLSLISLYPLSIYSLTILDFLCPFSTYSIIILDLFYPLSIYSFIIIDFLYP